MFRQIEKPRQEKKAIDMSLHDADLSSCISDAPTDDAELTYMLPCYGHMADEDHSMDEADYSTKPRLRGAMSRKGRKDGAKVPVEVAMESKGKDDARANMNLSTEEVARMVSQNARLALENKRLREQCEKAAAAASAAAAAASAAAGVAASSTPSAASSKDMAENVNDGFNCSTTAASDCSTGMQQMMITQPYMGQWWSPMPLPYNNVGAPMMQACFVMPNMDNGLNAQQPKQRRSKAARQGGVQQEIQAQESSSATPDKQQEIATCQPEERTTVMLRNMPNNYNRKMLLQMMDSEGFAGQYNFVYMPIDFKSKASLGYAFINLNTPEMAQSFWNVFDGYSNWMLPSRKISKVSWSSPHQGLEAHVERYRNSPLMHQDVPDDYRPILLEDGVRVIFPQPTKRLRAPRLRHSPIERLHGNGCDQAAGLQLQSRSRHVVWDANVEDDAAAPNKFETPAGCDFGDTAIMTDEEDFWF
mmetsp:Transcript_23393/g.54402  ORF Transcript_23393/g.54402 Transcript_23393/m.54402 type:complete len:474 (-) Transcript_23393:182-1603(-)|eukprot:CAMPEP_0178421216 /NCGR_PEP_ID=MMETSP0689_2-20121128/26534_1 /TAXON_ID=160604 /ORGANISM="Amphidinium massartii, Strain CS-259" /LENGTH=473 /DNA_ID=CAMNT_0020042723 /DNA_START=39 /DNA_END=1460 /DNA_ORIENTATION=-